MNLFALAQQNTITVDALFIAIIFGVLILLVAIAAPVLQQRNFSFFTNQMRQVNKDDVARLEARISDLEEKVRQLRINVDTLQQENIGLQKLNNKLEADNRALINELSTYLNS